MTRHTQSPPELDLTIPRILHCIWVGPKPAPMKWINTWIKMHPHWDHVLHDNDSIFGRPWKQQRLIDAYREESCWRGVADVARYEILYEVGGAMHGADSICLHPIDELLTDPLYDCYSIYENEKLRPGLVAPLYACTKGNEFAKKLRDGLKHVRPGVPWKTTGNMYMKRMIELHHPTSLQIWPSYMLIPVHYTGETYRGDGRVYAIHKWGSTCDRYDEGMEAARMRGAWAAFSNGLPEAMRLGMRRLESGWNRFRTWGGREDE